MSKHVKVTGTSEVPVTWIISPLIVITVLSALLISVSPARAVGFDRLSQQALPSTSSGSEVTLTIIPGGAYLRAEPTLYAPITQPVFANQVYRVIGRTADLLWVQLDMPTAGAGAWFLTAYGIPKGDLLSVPIVKLTPRAPRTGLSPLTPKWIPTITPQMRQLYLRAVRLGKDPAMFTVVGDCNSETTAYLGRLAAGTFQLSKGQENLETTIARFSNSFPRASAATQGSFSTSAMFDDTWADPARCKAGEGPLACELRMSRASIVFIALGTGDQHDWQNFEKNYRAVITATLSSGVLPVLVTKADDLETHAKSPALSGYINDVIRRLGKAYGLPVMDFWLATRGLPNYGLRNEGNDNFHMTPAGSDTRILATLQALTAIARP